MLSVKQTDEITKIVVNPSRGCIKSSRKKNRGAASTTSAYDVLIQPPSFSYRNYHSRIKSSSLNSSVFLNSSDNGYFSVKSSFTRILAT